MHEFEVSNKIYKNQNMRGGAASHIPVDDGRHTRFSAPVFYSALAPEAILEVIYANAVAYEVRRMHNDFVVGVK